MLITKFVSSNFVSAYAPPTSVLEQALARLPLLLESPPAEALAERLAAWLEESGCTIIWLRFSPEETDPGACLRSLIAAARCARPEIGAHTLALLGCRPSPPVGWPTLFSQLAAELVESLPEKSALVLDQLHHLGQASPALKLLESHLLPALAGRWLCILLPPSAGTPTLLAPSVAEESEGVPMPAAMELQAAPLAEVPRELNPKPTAYEAVAPVTALPAAPTLHAYLLGKFRVVLNDQTLERRPPSRALAVFKYLLAHADRPTPREVLMDKFWPDAYEPELARNSLNVAVSGLRRALRTLTDQPVVVFENGAYQLNPEFQIWVDAAAFEQQLQRAQHLASSGQAQAALCEYEAALNLYTDDFLADDPYEEWPVVQRERLRLAYLNALDRISALQLERGDYAACVSACQTLLARDACREDIHCRLMVCFARQDQQPLALRQYQACVEALRAELQVAPAPATTQLYQRLRRRERV